MRYYPKINNKKVRLLPLLFFISLIFFSVFSFKDIIYRSLYNVSLASLYVEYLDFKAEIINNINSNKIKNIKIDLSSNNFVRIQKERSSRISDYILHGSLFNIELPKMNYYPSNYSDGISESKSQIKLFGMNPDHYRDSDAHSFRLKFKGGSGYGNQTFNFLNPRVRDYITDPLFNIIYHEMYGGIKINYEPNIVFLNKSRYGLFYKEDFFDKYLIENNERRESVIFEIIDDEFNFNYLGIDNEFEVLSSELKNLYINDYSNFLELINRDLIKSIIVFSLIINDNHPLIGINMHWYFNPASGLIEPTFREGSVYEINDANFNIDDFILNIDNRIIQDVYFKYLKNDFNNFFSTSIKEIEEFIKTNTTYENFKSKMKGFKYEINNREIKILKNINFFKKKYEINISNNEEREKIYFKNDTLLTGNIIYNKNQDIIIEKGTKISLKNANIRFLGNFKSLGDSKNPIKFEGIAPNFGTIYFNSDSVEIFNTHFKNLSNLNSNYAQPSSITFYECKSIIIDNSIFTDNKNGDDYINFFRSKNIVFNNSIISNVLNDAIDSDFSNLKIDNLIFDKIGNDGLDGSGSTINISNSKFSYVFDKAISAGEKSDFTISNCKFINNEIALVSKDESYLKSFNNYLNSNKLDFASFKKKKIYFYPKTDFINTGITSYLIENESIINGLSNIEFTSNVEMKLYGNEYGRASIR